MLSLQTGEIFQGGLAKFRRFKSGINFVNGGFVFSWLISLIVLFGLVGCSGTDSSASSADTASSAQASPAKVVTYNFYDSELDFISSASSEDVSLEVKANEYGVGNWYTAKSAEPFNGAYEGDDEVVRLYPVQNVVEITSEDDLADIASDLSGKYILLNDITLTSDWTPIGSDEDNAFTGILNADTSTGARYAIIGLNIPKADDIRAGLFGFIKSALIKNIGVVIDSIVGTINVGGIAGQSVSSNITNSYVLGNITGDGYVGGIVGNSNKSAIINSFANVTVKAESYTGGLVGYVDDSLIANSYAVGVVGGGFNIGGIAGSINASSIVSSYAGADVSGNSSVGNIAGVLVAGNITGTLVITKDGIGAKIKDIIGKVIEPQLSNVSNNAIIDAIVRSLVGSLLDTLIDNAILGWFNDQYVYQVALGWKLGKDDANPWVIGSDGKPILYWQAWTAKS